MKKCNECWSKIPDSAMVCPKCGASQPSVVPGIPSSQPGNSAIGSYGTDNRKVWYALATIAGLSLLTAGLAGWTDSHCVTAYFIQFLMTPLFVLVPCSVMRSGTPRYAAIAGLVVYVAWVVVSFMAGSGDYWITGGATCILMLVIQAAMAGVSALGGGRFNLILTFLAAAMLICGIIWFSLEGLEYYQYIWFGEDFGFGAGWYSGVVLPIINIVFAPLFLYNMSEATEEY